MRVLVDTSAWVDYLNGHPSREAIALRELIVGEEELCTSGVIVAEVFQGLKRDHGRAELESLFRELTYLEEGGIDEAFRVAELYRALRKRGWTIRSTIDCLIAVQAARASCAVLARDSDLETILKSGLISSSRWQVS